MLLCTPVWFVPFINPLRDLYIEIKAIQKKIIFFSWLIYRPHQGKSNPTFISPDEEFHKDGLPSLSIMNLWLWK
jgi:hypothetical protein